MQQEQKIKEIDYVRNWMSLSSSKGYEAMAKEAEKIHANTFQFFTRNPRGAKAKEIKQEDVDAFLIRAKNQGIDRILAHAPYT